MDEIGWTWLFESEIEKRTHGQWEPKRISFCKYERLKTLKGSGIWNGISYLVLQVDYESIKTYKRSMIKGNNGCTQYQG